ncbi:hypothetical protein AGMMS49992_00410 [Clostridia bacterium]|nr:hypothetical protein AGMMS49992_00410 [Clostridia bacterium]
MLKFRFIVNQHANRRLAALLALLITTLAFVPVGLAAGAVSANGVWTDAAFLQTYGVTPWEFRPANPAPRTALLILGGDNQYKPNSGTVAEDPQAAFDELGSELSAIVDDLTQLADVSLIFTQDPNSASLFIIVEPVYPYAGQYGGYLDAYNCTTLLSVIDAASGDIITVLSAESDYGEAIDATQFSEGTTVIWKKLPLPSESAHIGAFIAALNDFFENGIDNGSVEQVLQETTEPTAVPDEPAPNDVPTPTDEPPIPDATPEPTAEPEPTATPAPQSFQPTVLGTEGALQFLGDEALNKLYAYLAGGKTITRGSSGDYAKTFQSILISRGAEIKADGQVGSKTIEAYQAVYLAALGQPASEIFDAQAFEQLLMAMVADRDAAAARALYPEADPQRIDWLYANGLYNRQLFYSAYKLYSSLDGFTDSTASAAACAQPWPSSGLLERASAYRSTQAELTVVTTRPDDTASLVRIYATDGTLAVSLFLAGSTKYALGIAPGSYIVQVGMGKAWYGVTEAFGADDGAQYSMLVFSGGGSLMNIEQGKQHTLSLLIDELSGNAIPVNVSNISWDAFAGK